MWRLVLCAAISFVWGAVLSAPALAQSDGDAGALNAEVVRLYGEGKYAQATEIAKRALALRENALGHEHPEVAIALNNLAVLYDTQGQHAEAEPHFKRSLAIYEKALGPEHPDVAATLNNLVALYWAQGR